MKKLVFLTNIPSPYSVQQFESLQRIGAEYEMHFLFTAETEDNRQWKPDLSVLRFPEILPSRVFRLPTSMDHRYVHIPYGVKNVLARIDPDAVIAWEYNPAALESLSWCRKHHRKFIHVTEGTLHSERSLNLVQKQARKKIITSADYCIGASTKAVEKLLAWGAPADRTAKALLTYSFSEEKDPHPEPGRMLYVGSMVPRKGLDLLIQAMPFVDESGVLRVVGNGTEEEENKLRELAVKNHVDHRIRFCGYRSGEALRDEYRKAQVFILPTREDCFGLVLLEAAVNGLPIVSSIYADGAYEIIVPGVNGELADPENPRAFAEAVNQVLQQKNYSEHAQQMTWDRFELDQVSEVYLDVIRKVLSA